MDSNSIITSFNYTAFAVTYTSENLKCGTAMYTEKGFRIFKKLYKYKATGCFC